MVPRSGQRDLDVYTHNMSNNMQMGRCFRGAKRGINLNINNTGSFSPTRFTGTGVERIDYIQNDLKVTTLTSLTFFPFVLDERESHVP
ncbi:hypothetical protein QE152_g8116 [Popillia japonica]|uniref:Uncharacterized protein n=1 Tax=Popillia japonica TaxID=7064 RepID=A0AAW1MB65_POPJA